ncbi:MAG: DUF1015 domain-containing protein [Thermodesulfovibrio sp.]|nr:DUF1015 domain-containing protein [Thermodesulfovibrio sp.]
MAILKPFKGILYNSKKVKADDVVCPPYDIISDELRDELYRKSPFNIVRIDYGKNDESSDKYALAKFFFHKWLKEEILIQDETQCFYGYEVNYRYKNKDKILRGLIALVKLEELGDFVYPHEQTYSKPKADRLNLMRACMANTSLIFTIYRSKEKLTSKILEELENLYIQAKDLDGNIHSIYKISDETKIKDIIEEFKGKPLFIADGHHRYEVALDFKREMESLYPEAEDAPWNYVLMFLSNIEDNGYLILPTHRLLSTPYPVKEVIINSQNFTIKQLDENFTDIEELVENEEPLSFGVYLNDKKWYLIKYIGPSLDYLPEELRNLDVSVLEEAVLKALFPQREICYDINIKKAMKLIDENKCDAIFVLRSTKVEDIERVAFKGIRMPPKSTYFYPKLLTGMIINSLKI